MSIYSKTDPSLWPTYLGCRMHIWRVWVSKENIYCLFISRGCVFFNVSGRTVEHKPLQGCKPGHLLQGSAVPAYQWACTSVPLCEDVCVCVCLAAPIQNHGHRLPEGTRSQIFFCQPKCISTICWQQMSPLQSTAHTFYQRDDCDQVTRVHTVCVYHHHIKHCSHHLGRIIIFYQSMTFCDPHHDRHYL